MNPIIDVTLEKGNNKRLTKKFKKLNTVFDKDIKFQFQLLTKS